MLHKSFEVHLNNKYQLRIFNKYAYEYLKYTIVAGKVPYKVVGRCSFYVWSYPKLGCWKNYSFVAIPLLEMQEVFTMLFEQVPNM